MSDDDQPKAPDPLEAITIKRQEMDLAKHPTLLANLYEPSGSTLVLAAHANAEAPAHCRRDRSLPYTGSHTGLTAWAAAGLLAAGGVLLLVTRRRSGSTPA